MSCTVRFVRFLRVLSACSLSRTICSLCWLIRAFHPAVLLFSSMDNCVEFLQCWSKSPSIGLNISVSALDKLHVADPMLSTMGQRSVPGLSSVGVPQILGMMLAVGTRWLYDGLSILF